MIGIPIGDENPCRIRPVAHWSIWVVCLLGSLATIQAGWATGWQGLPVVLNLILLAILGDNVEERLGSGGYVAFAVAAAAIGGMAALFFPGGARNLCAALHAVCAAAIGAYAMWYPGHGIRVFYVQLLDKKADFFGIVTWPALWVLGIWGIASLVAAIVWPNPSTVASIATFVAAAAMAAILEAYRPPRRRVEVKQEEAEVEEAVVRKARDASPEPPPEPAPSHFLEVSTPGVGPSRVVVPSAKQGAERWAVVRVDEGRIDLPHAARIVSVETGEIRAEAALRIRRSRGVVARRLEEARARRLVEALGGIGAACRVVPDGPDQEVPPAREADLVAVTEGGIRVSCRDGTQLESPWPQVFLVLGLGFRRARDVEEDAPPVPVIELFNARPYLRMRARKGLTSFLPTPIRGFAQELLRVRRGTPVNPGVAVIAGGGRFGYLHFDREVDLENYVWWIVQLLRNPSAESAAFSHYLE